MNKKQGTARSKFLSFVLRHDPAAAGVTLDSAGWVAVDDLLEACAKHDHPLTRAEFDELVATSSKQRFAVSADGLQVRANQGHSTKVELGYEPVEPPDLLFHGTFSGAIASIRKQGLLPMERHHVHMSANVESAQLVGKRRGTAVILRVDAGKMYRAGHVFYRTPNDVWLTDSVPVSYLGGLPES